MSFVVQNFATNTWRAATQYRGRSRSKPSALSWFSVGDIVIFRSCVRTLSAHDLQQQFLKTNKDLTDKTVKLVEEYAKKNKVDLVLDKSDKLRGPVLFRTPSVDITDEIVKQINE